MTLTIEGIEPEVIKMSMDDLKLEIAIMLYQQGRLSMGKASKIVNMNRIFFQEELGKRGIPVNYDKDELNADLATLGLK